jgi:outer membrane immunogenic protein
MRTIFAAGLFVTIGIAAVPARAADLARAVPVKAPVAVAVEQSWAGHYIGLHAGYAWGRAHITAPFDSNTGFFYNFFGAPYDATINGFLGGVTFGHNWQSDALVFGVEAEAGWLGLKGSATEPNDLPNTNDTVSTFRSRYYAAAYARAGVASGAALLFVKAGAALLDAEASTVDPCVAPPATCGTTTLTMTGSKWMTGWTAGAGVEWMLGPQWSAKAEYAYFDFGRIGVAGPSSVAGEFYRQTIDVKVHTVKLGLNWRFGPAAVSSRY